MVYLAALVLLLGHPSFRIREAATTQLTRLPAQCWFLLRCIALEDAEAASRLSHVQDKLWQRLPKESRVKEAAKLLPTGWLRLPNRLEPGLTWVCWQNIPNGNGKQYEWRFSLDLVGETARETVAALAACGTPLPYIQQTLDRMAALELQWWEENREWLAPRRVQRLP